MESCSSACSDMGFKSFICVLLYVAALTLSGVLAKNESCDAYRWTKQSLPRLMVTHTQLLKTTLFRGQEDGVGKGTRKLCGIECQNTQPLIDQTEQERFLGYETVYENGTRTHANISLQWMNKTSAETQAHSSVYVRKKRQVYGEDGRFVISDSHFITNYPFSTAARLSTGCSGVLVSPKHVLTAAHCVHDGKDYLESARRLKVGLLQIRTKRRRVGRRRGGRKRGERKKADKEDGRRGEEQLREEGEENITGREKRRRWGGGRVHRGKKREEAEEADAGNRESNKRGPRKRKSPNRLRRSEGTGKQPVFRWTRVKQTQIPQGWIQTKSSTNSISPDYDYALLELRHPVKQKYMEIGVAPPETPLGRIHFSGYDTDKSLLDGRGDEKVIYRFCSVTKESDDLMYQHCDAQNGATGAGVYVRLRQDAGHGGPKGKWQRRVIGVFSGHQWVDVEGGEQKDFNVAVRITPPKYAQICHWIHRDPSLCKEI